MYLFLCQNERILALIDDLMRDLSRKIRVKANKLGIQFPTPLPLFRGTPNIEHMNMWAESQITPAARKIAYKMIKHLQYIPFEEFLNQLNKTIEVFHQKINDEPYVLLIGESKPAILAEGCSDQWMIGLAFEYCDLKEPEAILTLDEISAWQRLHPTVTKMLMLDDAAYSGEQKRRLLTYFRIYGKELQSRELSLYLGIPYITKYAKNILSAEAQLFKQLIFLDQVYMPSTMSALNDYEVFYAQQANIDFIDNYHTLTYFDHRFADGQSCFQQIYNGSNLLANHFRHIERFSGYSNEFADVVHNNHSYDAGYIIPTIFSPYRLRELEDKNDLDLAIQQGSVGIRSEYTTQDPDIANMLSKTTSVSPRFFSVKKIKLSMEKQIGYDKAVMLGNHNEITYAEQVTRHLQHQQLQDEIKKTAFQFLRR